MGQKAGSPIKEGAETGARWSRDYYRHRLLKRHEHIDFDVEAWYPILQSETFTTEFIPISPSIARAFVHYYQTRYNSKQLLTRTDVEQIRSVEDALKRHIVGRVFIRLSSRSPKDGTPLHSERCSQLYQHEWTRLQDHYPEEMNSIQGNANMQLIAYSLAQSQCLSVTNETEALALILSSERVFIDLLEALDCHEAAEIDDDIEKHEWNDHIIVRQWDDRVDHSMEFRCFVYQSKLTAVSQYNHYCKFYHLQDPTVVEQVRSTIIRYWQETLVHLLKEKYSNYVIDLALISGEMPNEYQCRVIEMNPFAPTTGASLFDWKFDQDQLTGLGDHIEIRIRSDYFPKIEDYVQFILGETQSSDHQEAYDAFLNKSFSS